MLPGGTWFSQTIEGSLVAKNCYKPQESSQVIDSSSTAPTTEPMMATTSAGCVMIPVWVEFTTMIFLIIRMIKSDYQ